jgi:hypothetical protein
MKKPEIVSSILGALGFTASVVAIIISVQSNKQSENNSNRQIELEKELRQSKIVFQIGLDDFQDSIRFKPYNDFRKEYSATYNQTYNVLINNLGYIDASITDLRISLKGRMPLDSVGDQIGWSYPSFKVFSENYEKIELPLIIEPNHPLELIIEVPVKVPTLAWGKVVDSLIFNRTYQYKSTEDLFLDKGNPFFGQLDPVTENSYGDQGNLQEYHLTITKGDGTTSSAIFFHNVNDFWIQGESQIELLK